MQKIYLIILLGLTVFQSGCALVLLADGERPKHTEPKQQRSIQQVRADGAITSNIKARFENNAMLKNINVRTYLGVVTLYGNVATHKAMERAIRLAQLVDGVKNVKSGMRLR